MRVLGQRCVLHYGFDRRWLDLAVLLDQKESWRCSDIA
jgi:hypothetical protein